MYFTDNQFLLWKKFRSIKAIVHSDGRQIDFQNKWMHWFEIFSLTNWKNRLLAGLNDGAALSLFHVGEEEARKYPCNIVINEKDFL